eukprot:3129362-Rhodomonas_salina.1
MSRCTARSRGTKDEGRRVCLGAMSPRLLLFSLKRVSVCYAPTPTHANLLLPGRSVTRHDNRTLHAWLP